MVFFLKYAKLASVPVPKMVSPSLSKGHNQQLAGFRGTVLLALDSRLNTLQGLHLAWPMQALDTTDLDLRLDARQLFGWPIMDLKLCLQIATLIIARF